MEDCKPKADIIIDTTYGKNDTFQNIQELEKDFPQEVQNHSFGDIIIITRENKSTYYFVGKEGLLIENQPDDYNELTIPYEITQYLFNATLKYSEISYSGIFLRFDDHFLKNNIGQCQLEWNFHYLILEDLRTLIVNYPRREQQVFNHEFDILKIKSQDIYDFYINSFKEQVQFKIKYNLEGPDYEKFINKYGDLFKHPQISPLWTKESLGCGGSSNKHHGISKYYGPKDLKNEIIETVKNFYNGFNYELILE